MDHEVGRLSINIDRLRARRAAKIAELTRARGAPGASSASLHQREQMRTIVGELDLLDSQIRQYDTTHGVIQRTLQTRQLRTDLHSMASTLALVRARERTHPGAETDIVRAVDSIGGAAADLNEMTGVVADAMTDAHAEVVASDPTSAKYGDTHDLEDRVSAYLDTPRVPPPAQRMTGSSSPAATTTPTTDEPALILTQAPAPPTAALVSAPAHSDPVAHDLMLARQIGGTPALQLAAL